MSRTVEVAPERFDTWLERFTANNPDGPQRIESVARFDHTPMVVVLVRRGGFAVAVVVDGRMVVHKVGSRHVQSRTAAGGWSQQRFARRRANQADALVEAVAEHLARILGESPAAPTGGWRPWPLCRAGSCSTYLIPAAPCSRRPSGEGEPCGSA